MPLSPGDPESIGGYTLVDRLGSGGMGVVYLGRSDSGRQVAVKLVHPAYALDEEFRTRFRQEVAAARRVSGAFTAPVVDADPDAPQPWMATLYVPGRTLADVVARDGPLSGTALRVLALGLVEALRDIHRVGMVHRDLKPSNVLMAEDGPRVIDFGISYAVDNEALTMTGRLIGTPPFMSPEQFAAPREVTGASDVFSLGSLLVYAATGSRPFDGSSPYLTGYQVMYEPPALDGVAPPLRGIAERCLDKDPAARPELGELRELLRALPESDVPAVAPAAVPDPPGPVGSAATHHQLARAGGEDGRAGRASRRRVLVAVGAALAVAGLGIAAVRAGSAMESASPSPVEPASSASPAPAAPASVTLPPEHVPWDYQIGGSYPPAAGVRVVSRSHEDAPVPGLYNICHINAFQAESDEESDWDADLLLRDTGGKVVHDTDWDEAVLDIRTAAGRERVAARLDTWIDACAAKGYQALEPDNYGSFTRFPSYLKAAQAEALMKLVVAHAHAKGLAVAQKNTAELVPDRASIGLDFAIAEECAEYDECGTFADAFDDHVLVVEYTKRGLATACAGWSRTLSVVRRDEEVVPEGADGFLRETC
ncbi:endo alpha-1,4 polygalactosaminidase [Streptomyces pseudovenezuelae]|uniref:endo alpha-1,4 polygalactosaminidase n=1 Tax=Streptomyces pseudovenezuelae TaxID=67350 RepID=UPI002E821469|nr:endo alpha-1,4 polygalactosaminidase [Streptomyces pseudovenezuelae]WUA91220.1 endo alpha-1,4 polygalactosaminidase [Streptomyces pseudovenezuelae]